MQATSPCPTHADLALALAAEFRRPEPTAAGALDDLAAPLVAVRGEAPAEQLAACADLFADRFDSRDLEWSGIQDLLLDRVVLAGSGHLLALAVACVESPGAPESPSASSPVAPAASSCTPPWTSRCSSTWPGAPASSTRAGAAPTPAGSARTRSRPGSSTGSAKRTANLAWALRAAELRLQLPFARPGLEELRHRPAHLRRG